MAISVNNPQGTFDDSAASITLSSYAVSAGSNQILSVCVTTANNGGDITISGVTFDGNAMTQVIANPMATSNDYRSELWEYVGPGTTTGDIVATLSGSSEGVTLSAVYLNGAAQQTAEATASEDDSTDPADVSVTSITANAMGIVGLSGRPTTSFTQDANTTEDDMQTTADYSDQGGIGHRLFTTTGAYTMGWTGAVSEGCAMVAAAYEEAAAASSVAPQSHHHRFHNQAG